MAPLVSAIGWSWASAETRSITRVFSKRVDPETGDVQWHWYTEPLPGQPGSETWPNQDAMRHGGGMTWMTGTYDPELEPAVLDTGNPNPVHAGRQPAKATTYGPAPSSR